MANLLPAGLLARLIEESQDAVMVIDDRSILRYLNKAACMLSGYEQSAVIGRPLALLLPATVAESHHDIVGRYIGSPPPDPSSVLGRVREFTIVHASGEEIPVELKAVDLGRAEGTRYFGAFFSDLRERCRMEAHNTELLARLQRQALSDALTGLPNRRAFQSQAQQLAARVKRTGEAATIAIADIDHFKSVNDRYGHPAGDAVLAAIAGVIRGTARGGDSVGRIGGEEFALLFPATSLAAAADVAERIRAAVAGTSVEITAQQRLSVTISIGLANFDGDIKASLARADTALYRAKNGGRNRVERA